MNTQGLVEHSPFVPPGFEHHCGCGARNDHCWFRPQLLSRSAKMAPFMVEGVFFFFFWGGGGGGGLVRIGFAST